MKSNSSDKDTVQKPGRVTEKHWRSVLKAISWRTTATVITMIVSYFITGSIMMALEIGAIEMVAKMLLYYLHERAWNNISVGQEVMKPPDYEI